MVPYLVAVVVFSVVDVIWLGSIGQPLYDKYLGDLLAESPNGVAAAAFYLIYIAGLVFFVIDPALTAGSWKRALMVGGFFGFVTYATWDLTNLAVLADFPAGIVPIDLAWGTVLGASVSALTTVVVSRLGMRRAPLPRSGEHARRSAS